MCMRPIYHEKIDYTMKWVDGRTVEFLRSIVTQRENQQHYEGILQSPLHIREKEIETEIKHLERRLLNLRNAESKRLKEEENINNAKAFLKDFNGRSCIKV